MIAGRSFECRWDAVADARWCVDAVAAPCAGGSVSSAGCWTQVVALARALARVKRALGALSKYVILSLESLRGDCRGWFTVELNCLSSLECELLHRI